MKNEINIDQILRDSKQREELGIGKALTGPKGVLEDYKFHTKKEKIRKEEKYTKYIDELSSKAMPSGWMQQQIQNEELAKGGLVQAKDTQEEDEDIDKLLKELEEEVDEENMDHVKLYLKRLENLKIRSKKFGSVREVGIDEFVSAIEDEDPSVLVVIHVYQDHVEECKQLNRLLPHIAHKYSHIKFLIANSRRIESAFDDEVLPILLCYQNGDLIKSFFRIQDELGTRFDIDELESYLLSNEVLNED